MKRELTPVPPGYDQITPDVVRSNALSMIVWHGVDAEAVAMQTAKDCFAEGDHKATEIQMRTVREIRWQMERNGPELLEQHRKSQRLIAEDQKRTEIRKILRADVNSIPGPKIYVLLALEGESLEQAIELAGAKPSPEDTVVVQTAVGYGGIDPQMRLVAIDLDPHCQSPTFGCILDGSPSRNDLK